MLELKRVISVKREIELRQSSLRQKGGKYFNVQIDVAIMLDVGLSVKLTGLEIIKENRYNNNKKIEFKRKKQFPFDDKFRLRKVKDKSREKQV
jgi:hypothetical protein